MGGGRGGGEGPCGSGRWVGLFPGLPDPLHVHFRSWPAWPLAHSCCLAGPFPPGHLPLSLLTSYGCDPSLEHHKEEVCVCCPSAFKGVCGVHPSRGSWGSHLPSRTPGNSTWLSLLGWLPGLQAGRGTLGQGSGRSSFLLLLSDLTSASRCVTGGRSSEGGRH